MTDVVHTFADVKSVFEAIIEEHGADYVYSEPSGGSCAYVGCVEGEDPRPSCIVGHLLCRLGLIEPSKLIGTLDNTKPIGYFLDVMDLARLFTPDARELMRLVQIHQDQGDPWGKALSRAVSLIRNGG